MLIRVHAVSVNRTLDLVVRAGAYAMPVTLPHILGVDPSGVVAAVGEGVTARKVGDRVTTMQLLRPPTATSGPVLLGVHVWGGYAEYVKVPVEVTHPIPDSIDFATATVVSRHAPTALSMLRDDARLGPEDWVLVMGASGGLGTAGIQAAKHLGARVIAAAGADERVRAAVDLGADVGVNYRTQDLTAEVRRITGGRGVNVVFENIADAELFPKALASLARGGRLITAGAHGGGTVPLDVKHLYLNSIILQAPRRFRRRLLLRPPSLRPAATEESRRGRPPDDAATATALIDRLVHHAEILTIEGDSYRRRVAEAKRKSPRSAPER